MRRLSKSLVASLSIVSGTLLVGTAAEANGCGIPYEFATNTYSISSPAHFTLLASCDPTATFNLTADVNLAGITVASRNLFTGTFNGNGYTINNLTVTGSGLFDVGSAGASFTRVHFANAMVTASGGGLEWAGALVRTADGPVTISNSSFAGSVTGAAGNGWAGGFVGTANRDVTITGSHFSGSITAGSGGNGWVGGFVGTAGRNVTITDSYMLGSVTGAADNGWAAGFVGTADSSSATVVFSRNYMSGTITGGTGGNSFAAGFLGNVVGTARIEDGFVRAAVRGGSGGNSWAHGFVATVSGPIALNRTFFQGSLADGTGLNAWGAGTFDYATVSTVTQTYCVTACGDIGYGVSVGSLAALTTSLTAGAWDFSNTWCYSYGHNDGFPVLRGIAFGPNAAWGNCVPVPAPPPPETTTTTTTTTTTSVACRVASMQAGSSGVARLQPGESLVTRDGSVVKSGVSGSASVVDGALQVRGRGVASGASVDVWLVKGKGFLGTLTADSAGVVQGRLNIPKKFETGSNTLQMVERNCNSVGSVLSLGVNMSRMTTLPATGGGANPLTWLMGLLALAAGVTLRRRRIF